MRFFSVDPEKQTEIFKKSHPISGYNQGKDRVSPRSDKYKYRKTSCFQPAESYTDDLLVSYGPSHQFLCEGETDPEVKKVFSEENH